MIKINKSNFNALFDKLSQNRELFLPVRTAGEVNYGKYQKGAEVSLETLKTVKSAKDFFFPQSQTMMQFRMQGKNIEIDDIRTEQKEFVIFGVKACDFKSFEILDNVFLSEPVDTFYQARRNAGVIVTMACGTPETSCFCKAFGIDASNPKGDATCWLVGDCLYVNANTEKGEKLVSEMAEYGENADTVDEKTVEDYKEKIKGAINKLPYSDIDLSAFKPENLNELFDLPVWEELSEACLGCGACTFICPTCQCFDIRDFKTNDKILRFRCWDSCMYSDFTQMAAANSRTTQMQRFRQRFMHKLVYYPSQYGGTYSCVGCGRCVNKCPQHLNILKVIKKIGGTRNDDRKLNP